MGAGALAEICQGGFKVGLEREVGGKFTLLACPETIGFLGRAMARALRDQRSGIVLVADQRNFGSTIYEELSCPEGDLTSEGGGSDYGPAADTVIGSEDSRVNMTEMVLMSKDGCYEI